MPRLDPKDPRLAAPDFPHGSVRGYYKGCSCIPCRTENAAKTAARKARLAGRDVGATNGSSVDAARAREHVKGLLDADPMVAAGHVAAAAGVNADVVGQVVSGRAVRIAALTEECLLGVTLASAQARISKKRRPAGPTRDHLNALLGEPLGTFPNIAAAVGMKPDHLRAIADGRRAYVYTETANAIAAVTPAMLERNAAFVPARIPRMQMQVLQAQGWTIRQLSEMFGSKGKGLRWVGYGSDVVTQDIARRAAKLYREIGDREGPSQLAKERARRKGIYPSIHYDEDMQLIRDSIPGKGGWVPEVEPAERARNDLRIMGFTLRRYSLRETARVMGCTSRTVSRVRNEVGLQIENNAGESVLLDYFKPGQDALLALVAEHTDRIALTESIPLLDAPDLDYVAEWDSLVKGAERLRAEVEAWEEYEARKSWIPPLGVSWVA